MSERVPGHVADTGYLLCFGAISGGLKHLRTMFDPGLCAPSAVRAELSDFHRRSDKSPEFKAIAATLARAREFIDVALEWEDVAELELALDHLGGEDERSKRARHNTDASCNPVPVTKGKNAGESESIALCVRLGLPLLINETAGRNYARDHKRIVTESAAMSLRRLYPKFSSRELYQMHREMERKVNDTGEVVRGHLWFRAAAPSPTSGVGEL